MFMGLQFLAVFVLTPAYTAGTIAEEQERRTLEFVLATDLRNSEIVLGKFGGRLAVLTLLLLVGLPVLSALYLLGGIDPNLTLAAYAATGLSMASLAGLGIFNSVHSRRARDAIALTYIAALAYLTLSSVIYLLSAMPNLSSVEILPWPGGPLTFHDLADVLGSGNIIIAFGKTIEATRTNTLGTELPKILSAYALFHGCIAVAMPLWAAARLRR